MRTSNTQSLAAKREQQVAADILDASARGTDDAFPKIVPQAAAPVHVLEMYQQFGYRYRPTHLQALMSIFQIHGETANIWTHLIEFLVAAALWYSGLITDNLNATGKWIFNVFFLAEALKTTLSTMAHVFCHGSFTTRNWMWQIDYCGVHFYVLATGVAQLMHGRYGVIFAAEDSLTNYIDMYCWLTLLSTFAACYSRCFKPGFGPELSRMLGYAFLWVSSSLCTFARIAYRPAGDGIALFAWIGYIGLMLLAGVIMGVHIPECMYPDGRFDWFRSHSIMHVITSVAMFSQMFALYTDHTYFAGLSPDDPLYVTPEFEDRVIRHCNIHLIRSAGIMVLFLALSGFVNGILGKNNVPFLSFNGYLWRWEAEQSVHIPMRQEEDKPVSNTNSYIRPRSNAVSRQRHTERSAARRNGDMNKNSIPRPDNGGLSPRPKVSVVRSQIFEAPLER